MKRNRYQQGTLRLEERASGAQVWEYRWYETQIDGKRRRRSAMIGTFEEFPSESAAQRAVAALRANVNSETPRAQIEAVNFATLTQHYRERELTEEAGKTFATIRTGEMYLEKWVLPRWSSYRLGSKAKIRNLMRDL